jgi:hypothetical protein
VFSCGWATLAASIFLIVPGQAEAGVTITAQSASFLDVSSAIALASNGDTVVVPAGTASWSSTLVISKGITLQGATTITGPSSSPTVTDATIIVDNVPRTSANYNGIVLLINQLTSTQSVRLTGFTFRNGSVVIVSSNGAVQIAGTCRSVRVDHCHFDHLYAGCTLRIAGWIYGVNDHCVFDMTTGELSLVSHSGYNNQNSGWGAWADFPYFGSEKFWFIEDNFVNNLSTNVNVGTTDSDTGGRQVVRYNTFKNCNLFYHGSDTGAGGAYKRGTRAVEIYKNTFTSSIASTATGQNRGGSLLWHDNTYTGTYASGMTLKIYRMCEYEGNLPLWAGADGLSTWDYNATEADGTHVDGHAPYTYATGTHAGAANDSTTVVVSGTPWQTNQWVGYSVTNTNPSSPYFHGHNYIASNTANTLTLSPIIAAQPPPGKFNTGDTFVIHKVLIVLDQPGRGKGDLLTNYPNPTPSWPHQALEPCYSWNNTKAGANLDFSHNSNAVDILQPNIDYYNLGGGFGSTPAAVAAMYVAALNGVNYTGPYTYPHPLVSSVLVPPTNLRIVP